MSKLRSNPHKADKSLLWFPPSGGSSYHFEWGQYQDDIADLAAVLPPVLRPLQTGDAHVTPLEMLHVAAGAEREKEAFINVNASPHRERPSFP